MLPLGDSPSSVFQGNASGVVNSQAESVGLISSASTQGLPISHPAAQQAAEPSQSLEGWPSSLVSTAHVGSDADEAPDSGQAGTQHAVESVVSQDDQSGTTTSADVMTEASQGMEGSQGLEASQGSATSPELEACSDSSQPPGIQHGMKKRFKRLPVQVCAENSVLAAVLEDAVHSVVVVLTPDIASCALRMHAAWTFALVLRPSTVPCKPWQQLTAASAVMLVQSVVLVALSSYLIVCPSRHPSISVPLLAAEVQLLQLSLKMSQSRLTICPIMCTGWYHQAPEQVARPS